jgi:hypothetical protein
MARTTLYIAPQLQPDGTTAAQLTLDFKDHIYEAQALARARHIIRAKPLNNADRGYLLNCLDIGNYTFDDPATTPIQHTTPEPTTPEPTPTHIPSLNAADTAGAYAPRKPNPQYTGTAVLGIATMHKSNLVPIFNPDAAVDAATMRRN